MGSFEISTDPIGIFDSGMGGLTVLKEIRNLLPHEDIIYFGDTAHLPYGNKSKEAVTRYAFTAADFFSEHGVKLIVVACNTASVYAIAELKDKLSIPVIGVLESGVNAAIKNTRKAIGIIGTRGTINSRAYEEKISSINPELKIFAKPCPLFVPLIEEGWIDNPVTREVAKIYLSDLAGKIDSIILACTHYPLLKDIIAETIGPDVNVLDSATEVAKTVKEVLSRLKLDNSEDNTGNSRFFVSDSPDAFMKMGEKFLNDKIDNVELFVMD